MVDLGMHGVREQAAIRVVQGDAGFVAGGFDAEDKHGWRKSRYCSRGAAASPEPAAMRPNRHLDSGETGHTLALSAIAKERSNARCSRQGK